MLSFITVKGSISVFHFVLPFSTFRQKGNSKPHLTSPSTLFGIPLCMTLIIKNRHQRGASEFQSSHLLLLFFFFTSKVLSKFLSTIPIICQCSKGLSPLMMIVAETWEKTRCRSSAWHKLPVPDLIVKTISFKLQMAAAWCLSAKEAIDSKFFTELNMTNDMKNEQDWWMMLNFYQNKELLVKKDLVSISMLLTSNVKICMNFIYKDNSLFPNYLKFLLIFPFFVMFLNGIWKASVKY